MQSISQFGFTLLFNDSEEQNYQNVKNYIESICHKVEKLCKANKIENTVFHFLLDKNIPLFATIKYDTGNAFFGLYDGNNIYDTAEIIDISKLLTEEKYQHFYFRIENYIKYERYKTIPKDTALQNAWKNKLQNVSFSNANINEYEKE